MAEEQPRPRITIRDIALATGWHHTTISLALRNSPKLRAKTRLKIQKMAEKLGYVPDPMLSALNVYRQKKRPAHYQATLAWINNWPHRDGLLEITTFRKYYEGACDRAGQLGYAVEEFWLHDPGVSESRFLSILKARNIQGLLLPPQPYAGADFSLNCRDLSVVAFGYSLQPPVFHVVSNHHFHTMNLMISQLTQLGYKRIGLYSPNSWDEKVENAFGMALRFAQWNNPKLIHIPPCVGDRDALVKWLHKHKTDVVVSWDGVEAELRQLGYKLPEDLGFASLDLDENNPVISGTNENNFYIGQKSIDVLIGLLHRGEKGIPPIPTRLLVESTWSPGTTLRPQSSASLTKTL